MPHRILSSLIVIAALLVPGAALAQDTPTEREAAHDVLKKMGALEQSLDVPGMVAKLTGPNAARDQVVARAKELMDTELLAMADDIATHPEIGFEEKRSVKILTDYLKAHDFDVQMGVAGLDDGVRREVQAQQRRAEPRHDPRVRRAARHEGRVPRRPAQRAGPGRHGRRHRDRRVARRRRTRRAASPCSARRARR